MAALKRARDQDLTVHPEQDIEYVVVDNEKDLRERIALAHEELQAYDPTMRRNSFEPLKVYCRR